MVTEVRVNWVVWLGETGEKIGEKIGQKEMEKNWAKKWAKNLGKNLGELGKKVCPLFVEDMYGLIVLMNYMNSGI